LANGAPSPFLTGADRFRGYMFVTVIIYAISTVIGRDGLWLTVVSTVRAREGGGGVCHERGTWWRAEFVFASIILIGTDNGFGGFQIVHDVFNIGRW